MKPVSLEAVSTANCQICLVFDEFWHSIEKDWPNVTYRKIDATSEEGQTLVAKHMIMASPGILINGILMSVGGFNKEKIIQRLKELS